MFYFVKFKLWNVIDGCQLLVIDLSLQGNCFFPSLRGEEKKIIERKERKGNICSAGSLYFITIQFQWTELEFSFQSDKKKSVKKNEFD